MRRLALAAALLALAGCGGGEKQASPTDRWRQKADAACDRAEQAVRESGQARDVRDLERVMVRAGDIVLGTLDEIEALKVPEEVKATAKPVRDALPDIRKHVETIREATEGRSEFRIGVAAQDARTAGNTWYKAAERAGLKRCARRAVIDAAMDELTIPGFVEASAEMAIRLSRQVRALRGLLAKTSADAQRAAYWKQTPRVIAYVERVSPNQVPSRLDDVRFDADRTMDLETTAEEAVYWYRRGNAAKARAKERRFFALHAKGQKATIEMFETAGASGRELIPVLRREFRRGGGAAPSGRQA